MAAPAATNSATTGSAYYCFKLNDSTHLVVHRDSYYEYPFIYVKVCPRESLAVVIDTGCGAHHHGMPKVPDQEVRDFVLANILTSDQNSYDLLVLCTHCHFDHIGGIEAFSKGGARIVASGYHRDFLSPENREENSLCGAFRMKTPEYTITHFTVDGEVLKHRGRSLGLRILHTPGHTPDSMAIYDEAERWLFVGDTCYQRTAKMPWGGEQNVPIILPLQGNPEDFVASLRKLQKFVVDAEKPSTQRSPERPIRLAAGHTTSQRPAADFLRMLVTFCDDIACGKLEAIPIPGDHVGAGGSLGDEIFVLWIGEGDTDVSLVVPERFRDGFGTLSHPRFG